MTSPAFENEVFSSYNKELFRQHLSNLTKPARQKFQKIVKSHILFNLFFISLFIAECIYCFILLTVLVQTFTVAIHLSLIFATLFCYFTLQTYAYAHKLEKFIQLKQDFLAHCRSLIQEPPGMPQHHEFVADSCCQLASDLYGGEYKLFKLPRFLNFISASAERVNCLLFWKDFQTMKELLLQACVEEYIQRVRIQPTDLEAHARLANAYVMLSGLYIDPRKVEGLEEERWIPANKYTESFEKKFRLMAQRAIEEFKILSDYAPEDPWVHAQLAYSYRDLHMPEEEIKEYEILLKLCPEDEESRLKLGKLYFAQGENAKGLQMYNCLKHSNFKKAQQLIHFYDARSTSF